MTVVWRGDDKGKRHSRIYSFACNGCGLRWRIKKEQGPPPGWRRLRAGDEQVDLCLSCRVIGVWIDHPVAAYEEATVSRERFNLLLRARLVDSKTPEPV